MTKPFEILNTEPIYREGYLELVGEQVRLPDGQKVTRAVLHHPGAAVIIPQRDDGNLLMLEQYRHALRDTLLEFPAGTLDPGEEPIDCARREIEEETGHGADEWTELGVIHPSPGFCDEVQTCYLARGLAEKSRDKDIDEIIAVRTMTIDAVTEAIADGLMTDAKSIAIFTRARMRGIL